MTRARTHRTARPPRHGAGGFSLIEVIIALTVFAIGVLGLAIMVPLGSNRVGRAGRQTRGSTYATQRAEQLLTTPYGDASLTAGVHTDAGNPLGGYYYVRWTVTDNTPITSCKKILVEVSHQSAFTTDDAKITVIKPAAGG